MPIFPVDMTPEQKQDLKRFQKSKKIRNVSQYIRDLIRADMQSEGFEFSPDVEWGGKRHTTEQAKYREGKLTLFGDLLQRLNESIPVPVAEMTTNTTNHFQALIKDFESRDVLPDLLIVVKEANTILQNEGYIALMKWFGIVAMTDSETGLMIKAKRIMSADDD